MEEGGMSVQQDRLQAMEDGRRVVKRELRRMGERRFSWDQLPREHTGCRVMRGDPLRGLLVIGGALLASWFGMAVIAVGVRFLWHQL
jgi:hypothetical protein